MKKTKPKQVEERECDRPGAQVLFPRSLQGHRLADIRPLRGRRRLRCDTRNQLAPEPGVQAPRIDRCRLRLGKGIALTDHRPSARSCDGRAAGRRVFLATQTQRRGRWMSSGEGRQLGDMLQARSYWIQPRCRGLL
jgi:hypothetical protein